MIADLRLVARWMVRVWRPEPGWLGFITVGSMATAALAVGFPWLWQYAIDEIGAGASPVRIRDLATWMLVAGVGHALLFTLLQGARSVMNARVTRHARRAILAALAEADPEAQRAWRAGDQVARIHDDAGEKTSWLLCSGIFRAWEALLVSGGAFLAIALSEPRLAVWLLVPLPVLIGVQAAAQTTSSRRTARVQAAVSAVSDELATTFGAIRTVQAAGLVPAVRARFSAAAAAQRDAEIGTAVIQNGIQLLYLYGWQLAVVGLLAFGGFEVLAGRMTLGRYVTLEGLVATMVWPMFDFGILISRIPQAAVSLRRIDELLAIRPAAAPEPSVPRGDVLRTTAVRLGTVLLNLDLCVEPGRRVAIVGSVGAGKTVACEILAGLRTPTEGRVTFGGVPLGALGPGAQGRVAAVPQDPSLLSASVRENVLLGREPAPEILERALFVSQLRGDLPQLRDGLDTRVGERGVTVSGGQRQRIAIARALVGEPTVLILDDATSALDAGVEAAFWDALDRELPDLGVVLVTHRTGTLLRADEIVVLERGRVVQRGRHVDLVEDVGPYRTLYAKLRHLGGPD